MNDAVKEFIEENIKLIDTDSWQTIIDKIDAYIFSPGLTTSDIQEFFSIINGINVDIWPFIQEVPVFYYYKNLNISNIVLPDHITKIAIAAFKYSNVSNINLDYIETIDANSFSDCLQLNSVGKLNNCIRIHEKAFKNCANLGLIEFSDRIQYILSQAFANCGRLEIRYPGTKQEWKKIYIDKQAFRDTDYIIRCKDGDIMKGKR